VCPTGDGCATDATYLLCVDEVHRDLITTTAAISALSSFLMGLFANLPVGLAPGLGLNAYVRAESHNHTFHMSFTCESLHIPSWDFMGLAPSLIEKLWPPFSWKGT
jgi:hypothetical protein